MGVGEGGGREVHISDGAIMRDTKKEFEGTPNGELYDAEGYGIWLWERYYEFLLDGCMKTEFQVGVVLYGVIRSFFACFFERFGFFLFLGFGVVVLVLRFFLVGVWYHHRYHGLL